MNEKPQKRNLYNPSIEDVTVDIDKNGPNPETHTLKAGEIKEFPEYVAAILEEKLATRMLWKALPANKNRDARYEELLSIIRV